MCSTKFGCARRMGVARTYRKDPTNLIDAMIASGGVGVITWLFLIVPFLSNPSPSVSAKGSVERRTEARGTARHFTSIIALLRKTSR